MQLLILNSLCTSWLRIMLQCAAWALTLTCSISLSWTRRPWTSSRMCWYLMLLKSTHVSAMSPAGRTTSLGDRLPVAAYVRGRWAAAAHRLAPIFAQIRTQTQSSAVVINVVEPAVMTGRAPGAVWRLRWTSCPLRGASARRAAH